MKYYPILFSLLFLMCSVSSYSQNSYKRLYPEKCDSLIKANVDNPDFVILDVRTYGEWVGDHLEGSINRSTGDSDFQQRLSVLPKHKIYLLHCKSGGRSAGAFTKMQNLQFAEVYEMIGGINAWKSKQYSTTNVLTPKLMLVSHEEREGANSDTVKITITNRANNTLKFTSVIIDDEHSITHDFNSEISIEGAEDYTFSIYHTPGYDNNDSTKIALESNGGQLEFKVKVDQSVPTHIHNITKNDISIFPNPANGRIFIKGIVSQSNTAVYVYNLAGQVVLQKHNYVLDEALNISKLSQGVHIVRIQAGERTYSKKLIVKH